MPSGALPDPGFSEKVVHLTAEYWPYARSGGLAEAVRGIARYQSRFGVPTIVVLPFHRSIRRTFPWIEPFCELGVPVGPRWERAQVFRAPASPGTPDAYFIGHAEYFERDALYGENGGAYPDNHRRFAFFCRAALEVLPRLSPGPTLLHAHDWHVALALIYLKTHLAWQPYYDAVGSVMTVHNAGYQGRLDPSVLSDLGIDPSHYHWRFLEWYGKLNLLKGALVCADMVTTVSATHALELRTAMGGFGLHHTFEELGNRFVGVLNGIEMDLWDPSTDPALPACFRPGNLAGKSACKVRLQEMCSFPVDPTIPLVGMSARLVQQKGLDLILEAGITDLPAQWVFLGHGEPRYHERLRALAEAAPDRVAVRFDFSEELEHKLLGGADMLLMPSLYEPCGITQMRAQRYGALPVARRVGGLADTIEDGLTGFLFMDYRADRLRAVLERAIRAYADHHGWRVRMRDAMARDFGWARSVTQYQEVYRRAHRRHAQRVPLPKA
ncbi:MAG: glycogen synthase [Gemmatimonadetes bacterium]|nr:glycogen synthase [Gemmatimonadota bacterium]